MANLNFKQLIDLAIGTPEPGHVNFHALHCLLYSFAEQLNIMEKYVNCEKYANINVSMIHADAGSFPSAAGGGPESSFPRETFPNEEFADGVTVLDGDVGDGGVSVVGGASIGAGSIGGDTVEGETAGIGKSHIDESGVDGGLGNADYGATGATASAAGVGDGDEASAGGGGAGVGAADGGGFGSSVDSGGAIGSGAGSVGGGAAGGAGASAVGSGVGSGVAGGSIGGSTLGGGVGGGGVGGGGGGVGSIGTVGSWVGGGVGAGVGTGEFASIGEGVSMGGQSRAFTEASGKDSLQPWQEGGYPAGYPNIDSQGLDMGAEKTQEINKAVGIMKHQLDVVMETLPIILDIHMNENDFSAKADLIEKFKDNLKLLKGVENNYMFADNEWFKKRGTEAARGTTMTEDRYSLDPHLTYSPEKMLDQLMELKTEYCILTNKINELSATLIEHDGQRNAAILQELQDQMQETKVFTLNLKDLADILESKQIINISNIENIYKTLKELTDEKVDRQEIQILLANKVDYKQLQRKVSHEQLEEIKCKLERQFCELGKMMDTQEKNLQKEMEEMRITLGTNAIEQILKKFKEKIEADLRALTETMQQYMDTTNDECAAAGARIKVLQDLACLSCDTTCVMRAAEKSKVGKLPDAHASSILSPVVTYELSSIRKSGLMGYYRKDDFPQSTSAWSNRPQVPLKACLPRHAGGSHTTSTAKERVDKVLLNKK